MINKLSSIKDPFQEIRLFNRRLLIVAFGIIILMAILVARLVWLQIMQHHAYVTLSNQNQFNLIPLEPNRGLIFDRNGVLLAENTPAFSLQLIPDHVSRINNTLNELKKIINISNEDLQQFRKQLKQRRKSEPVAIKLNLTEEEVATFYVNQYRFPGVFINADLVRHYPLGPAFVHVLGYVGRINEKELDEVDPDNYRATNYIGKVGIEKFYEGTLHGNVGYQQVEMDASGRTIRIIKRALPTPGSNLYLTIDSGLQTAAEIALGSQRGAVVAIDPNNGQVLALVSNPSYDPNLFVRGISNKDFQTLRESPDQPLYNRAVRGQYPPGSTIKPFIAIAGLESGVVTPTFSIYDPGYFYLPNSSHEYHDWSWKKTHAGHGNVNLSRALMVSCDIYFFTLGNRLGIDLMHEWLSEFGFGKLTGIDMGEELPGIAPSPEWKKQAKGLSWYPGDTIISSIGQGFNLATPLQLANAVAAIATRGQPYKPTLLLKEQDSHGKIILNPAKPLSKINVSDATWEVVQKGMYRVVNEGGGTAYPYAHKEESMTYDMAGKTGTAQVFGLKRDEKYDKNKLPEKLRDHSLFIAYAPYDHPTIAIAIFIENTTEHAAGLSRKVLDYYFLHKMPLPPEVQPTTVAAKPVVEHSEESEENDDG